LRLLVVDDHAAVRAGLVALLRAEPGFVVTGVARAVGEALFKCKRAAPDVALVDYHLPDGDGLELCRELKRLPHAPGVIVYSAFADNDMALSALLAGADGLLDKASPADELFEGLRAVARGHAVMPAVGREARAASAAQLDREDLPILSMVLDQTEAGEMAEVLGIGEQELERRVTRMLERLRTQQLRGRGKAG
jgi:DNA-binding NarL/FixJ family response regulator